MKVITFANNKGGSAKTTTTTTVAHGLTIMLQSAKVPNPKVLVVDTDSQAHATLLLTGRKDYPESETLIAVLEAQRTGGDVKAALKQAIIPSTWDNNLHVLPASVGLDNTEESLVGQDGNVFFLHRILRLIKSQYAAILIDTCPKFSMLTKMALLASDEVMIPVAPQYLDADGLLSMINKVYEIRDKWERENPDVTGIAIVKFSPTVNGHNQIRDAIAEHPEMGKFYLGTVPLNAEIEYSHAAKQSIFQYNPRCKGANAYAQIVSNIGQLIFAGV
jgi:chromosome partitioning protein